ncbi:MAG: GntR family transcriptional regulator [Kiritimatiellae bacterium]|nr:GntR family transcriptional regulator [Kiritimatiellia bacterium]
MSRSYRFPLFAAMRSDGRTLVVQIADVLRQAILTGFYSPGELLPPMRELCRAAGVSMIVMNEVVAKLTAEGLVNPRRGVGCVVLGGKDRVWKGRVLFVVPESDGSYFTNVMLGTVRESLMKEGWLFHQVTLGCDSQEKHDFSRLDIALRVSTDLALTLWERKDILHALSKVEVPFVTISESPSEIPGCAGHIRYPHRAFARDFTDDCVSAGVRSVEQVGFMRSSYTAASALRRAGIDVKETVIPPANGMASTIMDVKQPVMDAFMKRLAGGKAGAHLPDLFYFDDDNVAEAALSALAYNGIKIPRDVRVVAFSNAGLGPCFPVPLARVVMDPVASGRTVARAALSYLTGQGIPSDAVIKPAYMRGPSFPVGNFTKKGSKR